MKVAYVSGAYRDSRGAYFIRENIRHAEEVAIELWKIGFAVICPHKNTALLDGLLPDEVWLSGDLELLKRCDLIVMMPQFAASTGANLELRHALENNIDIFFWLKEGRLIDFHTWKLLMKGEE